MKNVDRYYIMDAAAHLNDILHPVVLARYTKHLSEVLPGFRDKLGFQALAVCGISGIMVGGAVSVQTGIPLIVVRSKHSRCHSTRRVEGPCSIERYAVLDDFVESGKTVEWIVRMINKRWSMQCVGVLEYEQRQSSLDRSEITSVNLGEDCGYAVVPRLGLKP